MILHPAQQVVNLKADLGGNVEQNYIDIPSAVDTGLFEKFTVVVPATADTAQGDYLSFREPGSGTEKFAAWLDIDANGTTPTGALYVAAARKVKVSIVTGGTAAANAAAMKSALEADGNFDQYTISRSNATLTFTATKFGNATDVATKNTGDTGAGTLVATKTQDGAAAGIQSKYLTFRTGADVAHYVWMNVNNEGSDPSQSGTAHVAAIAGEGSASAVATAIATVLAAASIDCAADGARVKLSGSAKANLTDIGAGNTGFTVAVQEQGASEKMGPELSPSSVGTHSPSTF